ncbi:MAG: SLBB domain-containing protein [Spirochaetaceae bacterium]|jgi:Na+-translocating ferredoxin:NAD+ oxidoreductase RnfC subunit|nr:SLBB domain-containing protein [Spirochaetaceae bacterium]
MNEILTAKVKESGCTGAGGAGFPTSVKMESSPEYIIVNGVECEPLIQVDQQLTVLYAPLLLKTLDYLVEALGARQGIFALKEKYLQAAEALNKVVANYPRLLVKTLMSAYPMGDEQVLVYETIGRIVPEGGLPLSVGALVINVESLLNIHNALEGKAVVEKYITVTGAVRNPRTFKVPLGISMGELVEKAGGATVADPVLIDGGPLMGRVERNFDTPVIKTSKAIIVLKSDHPLVVFKERPMDQMMRLAKTACCHCMLCTDLCPRRLLGHALFPDKLMRLASYHSTCEKDAAATSAYLCCECRLCEYACIMQLQPWKLNRELKSRLKAAGIKNPHHDAPEKVNQFRSYRRYPTDKLVRQMGLSAFYHVNAPLTEYDGPVSKVTLPLCQHFGAPALPVVKTGDLVRKGDRIASMPADALGAHLHASIDGRIRFVDAAAIVIER